jgi:hypothetical protein
MTHTPGHSSPASSREEAILSEAFDAFLSDADLDQILEESDALRANGTID